MDLTHSRRSLFDQRRSEMMIVTMTDSEAVEYRHMFDPLDYDGGPLQQLAPGRPLAALSGPATTPPDLQTDPAPVEPAERLSAA